ncbi:MAG: hypothetical protein J6V72_16425, partial [Kiritimatiellae bacterium]|nr:hypothetical protein [Kiritimatiellia bacterium]
PLPAALSFAALVKGLVYSPLGLDMLEHFLGIQGASCKYGAADVEAAIEAIGEQGFDAEFYGRTLDSWIDLLYRLAPEGIAKFEREHPDVPVFTGVVDERLNSHFYIVPGLGDAGDRIFGTL